MLDLCVVLEGVHAQVLAVARLLEAAMGHLRCKRDVVVDPHAAESKRVRDPHGAADVAGPHRSGEAIWRAVRPRDRLIFVRERLDGDDRSEDLALDHLVVLTEACHHSWLEKEPWPVGLAAAGDELGVTRPSLQKSLDPIALAGGIQWPPGCLRG